MRLLVLSLPLLGACWKLDYAELPEGKITFQPGVPSPTGWQIDTLISPVPCPDGELARAYLLRPESPPVEPMAVAALFHSGAFDYELSPDPLDPLASETLREPTRLTVEWSSKRVFSTLGMFEQPELAEQHLGAMPAALASRNVMTLLPANCFGDLWHNDPLAQPSDAAVEGFERAGLSLATWSWRVLTDPAFREAEGVVLPAEVDPFSTYMIGQAEGSRAVSELIGLGYEPTSIIVDSASDSLDPFYNDAGLYAQVIAGLDRVFPGGQSTSHQVNLYTAPSLPDRMVFVYSTLDPQVPAGANDDVLVRLASMQLAYVYDTTYPVHVQTGADLAVAEGALDYVLAP